jgi:hypothetical protein
MADRSARDKGVEVVGDKSATTKFEESILIWRE